MVGKLQIGFLLGGENLIKIVNGDILEAKEDIICQQVNCMGVMGAGLAKQIRVKYPKVFQEYKKLCDSNHRGIHLLGSTQYVDVSDSKTVVNLFGQYRFGRNGQFTDYSALRLGLKGIYYTVTQTTYKGKSLAIPYGIGCGLAGGEWDIVYKVIEEVFSDYDVTIYKYEG